MIYQEMSKYQMMQELTSDGYASWTYDQAEALIEHLEEYAQDDFVQFDSVALRCEFTGYSSIEEATKEYDLDEGETLEDKTDIIYCGEDYQGEVVVRDF